MAPEPPFGATVTIWRRSATGDAEYLLLRRSAAHGKGDWEWTPPAGARRPGEPIAECAARELTEETGLTYADLLHAPFPVVTDGDWLVWLAEVAPDATIVLDAEHTEFRWVGLQEAVQLCRPQIVADNLALAATTVDTA